MKLSEQVAEMREEQAKLNGAIGSLAARITAKLNELEAKLEAAGEVDPDLTADIASLRNSVASIDTILNNPAPAPPIPDDERDEDDGTGTEEEAPVE